MIATDSLKQAWMDAKAGRSLPIKVDVLYNYAIIKENYPELEREDAVLHNSYDKDKKYAFIQKLICVDRTEKIGWIDYSNSLQDLHERARKQVSWYNYPAGIYQDMQGNICKL